jgi:hypothetical protein
MVLKELRVATMAAKKLGLLLAMALASPARAAPTALERDRLRTKLEDHFNQLDLMIRNQNSDLRDIDRQEREMAMLRVFDRIPRDERVPELMKELRESAREFSRERKQPFELKGLKLLRKQNPKETPKRILSDTRYRMSPDDTVATLEFEAQIKGSRTGILEWVSTWPDQVVRLVEPIAGANGIPRLTSQERSGEWKLKLRAYRYLPVEYPRIDLRAPRELLPAWAKTDLERFASTEPLLWSFVTRSESLAPRATPLFENRRKFLLNASRMAFFLKKSVPRPPSGKSLRNQG